VEFLDVFAKLRKATIIFVMSIRIEQIGSHWTDFHEILTFEFFFRKSVEKIQVSLLPENNMGYVRRTPI